MAMAVLSARLYEMTSETKYLSRAYQTINAISSLENNKGIYLNDRDGWTDGQFAYLYASEALSLPGVSEIHKERVLATSRAIVSYARTSSGYYSADWLGGSVWSNIGTTSSQIMTTCNSAHMIIAASA